MPHGRLFQQAAPVKPRGFYDMGCLDRPGKTWVLPQPRGDQGQRVAERRPVFGVPGTTADHWFSRNAPGSNGPDRDKSPGLQAEGRCLPTSAHHKNG